MEIIVLCVIVLAVLFYITYTVGKHNGTKQERERCSELCYAAIKQRWSPSLRWVINAIDSGSKNLIKKDQFFVSENDEVINLKTNIMNIIQRKLIPQEEVQSIIDLAYIEELMNL